MKAPIPPPPPQPADFPFAWILALYTCAFLAVGWPWLSGVVTIPWDAKAQFYPQQVFLARALAEGVSPAWTSNLFTGWPQIADPQSLIFSPLHLALALADRNPGLRAFDAVTFAALFLGGLGIIAYFRDRGWHAAGAIAAALTFAFGGVCAARIQHTGQVLSIAFFPLALWMLSRALERRSWLAGALAGLLAALMALGRDQVSLLGLYVLATFVVAHWFRGAGRIDRVKASAPALLAGGIMGMVVLAAPLLLSALLGADSNRPTIDYEGAARGSLHPGHLITLAFADLFGANDPVVPFWGPGSFLWGETGLFLAQNMGQLYAGALAFVAIAGIGIVRGVLWSREIRFFSVAALATLLYALGWYTPFFRGAYELLPGVSLFRRPADAAFVLNALLAILAGYCLHRWLAARDESTRGQRVRGAALGLAVFVSAFALAAHANHVDEAAWPILFGVGWLTGAVLVLVVMPRVDALAATALVMAFVAVDLRWNNGPNESTGLPPATYDVLRTDTANDTIALLRTRLAESAAPDRRDRIELSGIAYHWPNLPLIHGFNALFGQNPLRLKDFARATGVGDTVAVPSQRTFAPLFPSYRSAFADLIGLRYIVTGAPAERIDLRLAPGDLTFVAKTSDAYVYENPRALPRAFVVTQWRQADFSKLLLEGWPADVDPRTTVLLEQPPALLSQVAASAAGSSARLTRYGTTEIVIDVEAPAGGLLVLTDVWHPWWRAEVNGVGADILKANVLFRAVALPAGGSSVRFTFHPLAGAVGEARAKLGLSGR